MQQFKTWLAIALLISSIVIVAVIMFRPQPIQIVLETGQEIVTNSPNYFTITSVLVLIICSFLIGAAITYLYFDSDTKKENGRAKEEVKPRDMNFEHILPLLREDEKKAVRVIQEKDGEILQNELVLKLGLSKVKTTRIVAALERKQIIEKHRHGMTNRIKLKGSK